MRKAVSLFLLGCFLMTNSLSAQNDTIKYVLSLDDVIAMAISQSSSIKYVQNRNVN